MPLVTKPKVAAKQAQPASKPVVEKAAPPPPERIQDHSEEADTAAVAHEEPTQALTPASSTGRAVAVNTGSGSLTPYEPSKGSASFDDLDENIGYGSFPLIKLEAGEFVMEGGNVKEFQCVMKSMRKKFLFKCDKETTAYSYDRVHRQDGVPLEDVFREWRLAGKLSNGAIPAMTEYAEVASLIVDGPLEGRMAILNIPPASVRRLAGYKAELKVGTGLNLDQAVTKVEVGPKVKTKSGDAFYPWDFGYAGKAEDLQVEAE